MFRIQVLTPVDIDPEEDAQHITREDAENEIAQLEEMQPENKYEIVVSDKEGAFIHADQWKQMTANDIISSIDIGLSVLKEKEGYNTMLRDIEDKEGQK